MKKRMITLLLIFSFAITGIIGRLGYIMFSGNYTVSTGYNSYTLTLDRLYPTIYDRNYNKLTNNADTLKAVIRPNEKCLAELERLFTADERAVIIDELREGYPLVRDIDYYEKCDNIKIIETKERHKNEIPARLLVEECEKYFPQEIGSKTINFSIDAKGRLLEGDDGTVYDNNYYSQYGAVLTINKNIQEIVENAAKDMEKGAVAVLDVKTGEALAVYSKPYDNLNRAFMPYAVGSVFKLVVSACAIENGIDISYECTGEITVGDTVFSCQKKKQHGSQHIKEALANSCNCYFINLALTLGAEKLSQTAKDFGFGETTEYSDEWKQSNGTLPDEYELSSLGQLALLGFGQGRLTASPIFFCSVIGAIANEGIYNEPRVLIGEMSDEGVLQRYTDKPQRQIISEKTAKTLRKYMRYVVTNGTGASADWNNASAGKTSTAQSGRYQDGREILNTWFAGFYPYDDPKYAIVVMTEDGESGSGDCCPIFRTIVENLY